MPLATRALAVDDARDNVAGSVARRAPTRAETNDVADGKLLPAGPSPGAGAVGAVGPGAVAGLDPAGLGTAHGAADHLALQAAAAAVGALARLLPELGGPAPGAAACRAEAGRGGRHGDVSWLGSKEIEGQEVVEELCWRGS